MKCDWSKSKKITMWFAATAMTCYRSKTFPFQALHELGLGMLVLNIYDDAACQMPLTVLKTEMCHTPGMKGLFWKRCLVKRPGWRASDYLWLFDMDIVPHYTFSLSAIEGWFEKTGAGIVQPSIRPAKPGGRMSDHADLNFEAMDGCAAMCVNVEVMTPIFRMGVWHSFHGAILDKIPNSMLATTVRGIDQAFSGFSHLRGQDTLVLRHVQVVHLDTRGYDALYRDAVGYDRPHGRTGLTVLDKLASMVRSSPIQATERYLWRHNASVMKAAACGAARCRA